MDWQFIVALVVAIPFILLPAAFIWYISVGGIFKSVKFKIKKKNTDNKPSTNGK